MNSVRDYLLNDHDIDVSNDTDYIGRNLIKLQLYFKELNYEINNEVPKYTVWMLFFSLETLQSYNGDKFCVISRVYTIIKSMLQCSFIFNLRYMR